MSLDNKNGMINVLVDVLKKNTDAKHPAKLNELGRLVSESIGKDKPVDSRTISGYIDLLNDLGFMIRKVKGGHYLEKRFLDRAEAKLLCDQIIFSSIIPKDRKEKIVEALTNDFSETEQELLKSDVSTSYKSALQQSIYNLTLNNTEKILDAIQRDKKITFKYGNYNQNQKLENNGKEYTVSPYQFLYEQGKYYLLCQLKSDEDTDETRNFRIDLMTNVSVGNAKRTPCPIKENLTDFCTKQINMYSPDITDIELEVNELGLRGLYDKLGFDSDMKIRLVGNYEDGTKKYNVKVKASQLGMKYFILQYLDQMTVLKPKSLIDEIKLSLNNALYKYNK